MNGSQDTHTHTHRLDYIYLCEQNTTQHTQKAIHYKHVIIVFNRLIHA